MEFDTARHQEPITLLAESSFVPARGFLGERSSRCPGLCIRQRRSIPLAVGALYTKGRITT